MTGFGFEQPFEGASNDWLTPPELVRRLGRFDLDPCGAVGQPWQLAARTYAPPQNGLALPWHGRVFCNPPYGPHVAQWAQRMAEHGNGVLLIFSRTETKAWRQVWASGTAFLFPLGRVCFYKPSGRRAKSGTAPSALVAYGTPNVKALRESGIAGALVTRVDLLNGIAASRL